MATRRDVGRDPASPADASGQGRPDRLGPVVHRRHQRTCESIGRGCPTGNKNAPQEPADHALGRSRGGWGSKLHLVTDGAGVPLAVEISAAEEKGTRFENSSSMIAATSP